MFASRADFQEATQKVKNKKKHNDKSRIQQEFPAGIREPNKIAASTHYDFRGKHLTPYGGLFPGWLRCLLQRILRERVWEAADVRLKSITLDTDTTVHTVYGRQLTVQWAWRRNYYKMSDNNLTLIFSE